MKDSFKNSLKNVRFSRKTRSILRTVLVSAATMIAVLAIVVGIGWRYRGRIFKNFANGYVETLATTQKATSGETLSDIADADTTLPSVFSDQSLVEGAVASANPAVVAITISKEEPKYTTSTQNVDPFAQLFGPGATDPFSIQVPTQTPDGTSEQEIGAGSGFLISSDGLIVTNKHVVAETDATYTVYLSNGKKYPAKVLARDAILDVAIVKIDATGLPFLTLGDSSKLQLGQSVIAIGNALGQFQNTVSVGVVSGLSRSITAGDEDGGSTEDLDHVIQTDAAINPGNSGGPLLDLSGHVIGIDSAIVQGSQNIGFAIPINTIKTVINSVEATGSIVRPYLGIRYLQIDDQLQSDKNLSVDYGDLVSAGAGTSDPAVIAGSPADKAGIKEGDIILDVDGTKLTSDQDLSEIVRDKKPGDTVDLTVLGKDGTQRDVKVVLQAAPEGQ